MLRKLVLWTLIGLGCNAAAAQTVTTFYQFNGTQDGGYPSAKIMQASDGNLYGTTGGITASTSGSVYRISLAGASQFATLYNFTGTREGLSSLSQLVEAPDGNFYGTTQYGGGPPARRDGREWLR